MDMEKVSPNSGISHNKNFFKENNSVPKQSISQHTDKKSDDYNKVYVRDVETVVDRMNEFIEPIRTNLKFVFHEKLNEYYVTVIDPQTDEIIREIPPKKMLDMYAAMADYMGILIDEKV